MVDKICDSAIHVALYCAKGAIKPSSYGQFKYFKISYFNNIKKTVYFSKIRK